MSLHAPRQMARLALSNPVHTTATISASRHLSTSQVYSSAVPPEAPTYIPLPSIPFSDETKPTRVRGSLPVPRKIFPQVADRGKLDASYLEKTYPRSSKPPAQGTLSPDHPQAWKRLMAESRRQNLQSGLQGLWRRKTSRDRREAALGAEKLKSHMEKGVAPERTDEFLTRPTVLAETLNTAVLPDPLRFEKAEKSRELVKKREERLREERKHALMELYVNAGQFIVEEADLEAEVDRLFAEDYWRDPNRDNVWQEYGTQHGVYDMVGHALRGPPSNAVEHYTANYSRNVKRQKKTAEELTGGKME